MLHLLVSVGNAVALIVMLTVVGNVSVLVIVVELVRATGAEANAVKPAGLDSLEAGIEVADEDEPTDREEFI